MGEEMNKSIWSKDYWKGAAKRFSSVRMLAVCAMLLALRIAVGSVFIPLGDSSLRIYFTFFIIALGASVYGPLMAVVAGCAADLLSFAIAPSGPFFPGYTLSSMLGGLIYGLFPECERVSCYASPASLQVKSEDELRMLRARGLQMVYMGLESGCDAVLTRMQKGHDAAAIVAAGQKARRCGFALSVTAISGLGSVELWRQHAMDTARAVSEMKPDYLGLLTLMVEPGTPLEGWVRNGEFTLLSPLEVLKETELFLQQVDSEGTVFRANHASNYLTLKGTLNGDREALLGQIAAALAGRRDLKPEFLRAL